MIAQGSDSPQIAQRWDSSGANFCYTDRNFNSGDSREKFLTQKEH